MKSSHEKYDVMRLCKIRDEVDEQTTFAFFENLHTDLSVAIERRENFDATIDREAISVQNIDFRDVAIDKNFDAFSKENVLSERSRTISDVNIERDGNFDDVSTEKIIDRDDEKEEIENFDSKADETTNC
ncbi:hypothetical protein G7Y79_00010g029430 [Physcia stellaris]|nr:hypothetical protein G7Y79_00010g029430 [Physcia stellaris]